MYFVYMVECGDGSLYTGITTDLKRRINEHNSPNLGAKYTKGRGPVKLVYSANFPTRSEASIEEARIKKLSEKDKLVLILK